MVYAILENNMNYEHQKKHNKHIQAFIIYCKKKIKTINEHERWKMERVEPVEK
jgi:hypothetical protein